MDARTKMDGSRARAVINELVRVGRYAFGSRDNTLREVSPCLGIGARRAKAVMYDEEQLPLSIAAAVEEAELKGWLKLELKFAEWQEYCAAKGELARLRKKQGELNFGSLPCSISGKVLKRLAL